MGTGGYSLPPATTTSAAAVTSLICGLLLCIPVLTGAIAVLTGIVGLIATGKPTVKGRGMAVAGLILGIISLAGWGAAGIGGYAVYRAAAPTRIFARQYIADLNAANLDLCLQHSTANVTKDQLTGDIAAMRTWGTLQSTVITGITFTNENGTYSNPVAGVCTFSGGQHAFSIGLVKESGQIKVDSFAWLQ
jgi:hypothetical protein